MYCVIQNNRRSEIKGRLDPNNQLLKAADHGLDSAGANHHVICPLTPPTAVGSSTLKPAVTVYSYTHSSCIKAAALTLNRPLFERSLV